MSKVWRYQSVIRIRKSKKGREYNDQKKKNKMPNNDPHNTAQKTKHLATRTLPKTGRNAGTPVG